MTANGDILVHIETRNGAIQPVSLELLTAARELADALGKKVEALISAAAPQQAASQLGAADRVLTVVTQLSNGTHRKRMAQSLPKRCGSAIQPLSFSVIVRSGLI